LYLGGEFNQKIDELPDSIKVLGFYYDCPFNQEIKKYPNSLVKLDFNMNFNQKLENLPETLRILQLDKLFNHPIDNLPDGLQILSIGNYYDPQDEKEYYYIDTKFDQPVKRLPRNLRLFDFLHEEYHYVEEKKKNTVELFIESVGPDYFNQKVFIGCFPKDFDENELDIETRLYQNISSRTMFY